MSDEQRDQQDREAFEKWYSSTPQPIFHQEWNYEVIGNAVVPCGKLPEQGEVRP